MDESARPQVRRVGRVVLAALLATALIVTVVGWRRHRFATTAPTVTDQGCDQASGGAIVALDRRTGAVRWTARTGSIQRLTAVGGLVVADPDKDGGTAAVTNHLVARDARTGRVRWCSPGSVPATVDGGLYAVVDGAIRGLATADGRVLSDPPRTVDQVVAALAPRFEVLQAEPGARVRPAHGSGGWSTAADQRPTVVGDLVVTVPYDEVEPGFTATSTRTVRVFDAASGELRSSATASAYVWEVVDAGSNDTAVLVESDDDVSTTSVGLLDLTTGTIAWEVSFGDPARSRAQPEVGTVVAAAVDDSTVYVATLSNPASGD